ncbi:unnamed protein product [Prorocentrum cordatum]|uniref:Peptidase A1 domain-containing protein n=1 Tax=Prorocentrum cordatum TaxID=2364126 RepID=A0ABN9XF29_9DINO|nr:unnamed protein product [Polarella glacialis]
MAWPVIPKRPSEDPDEESEIQRLAPAKNALAGRDREAPPQLRHADRPAGQKTHLRESWVRCDPSAERRIQEIKMAAQGAFENARQQELAPLEDHGKQFMQIIGGADVADPDHVDDHALTPLHNEVDACAVSKREGMAARCLGRRLRDLGRAAAGRESRGDAATNSASIGAKMVDALAVAGANLEADELGIPDGAWPIISKGIFPPAISNISEGALPKTSEGNFTPNAGEGHLEPSPWTSMVIGFARQDMQEMRSHPPITYTLRSAGGEPRDFVLDNTQYMTSREDACLPAFMRIDVPPAHGPAMVLGEVFLRQYFSVFDRGDGSDADARVGFARAKGADEVEQRLKDLTKHQPAFGQRGASQQSATLASS